MLGKNSSCHILCLSFTLVLLPHSQHFWQHTCRCFPTPSNSAAALDVLHFNSTMTPSVCLEIAPDPAGEGLSPGRLSPSSDARCNSKLSPVFLTNWLQIGSSHDPLLRFDSYARAAHKTHENSLLTVHRLTIKECDKGHRWISRWKRWFKGKVCGKGCSVCMPSLGMPLSQHIHIFTNREALPNTHVLEFLWRLHHVGMVAH